MTSYQAVIASVLTLSALTASQTTLSVPAEPPVATATAAADPAALAPKKSGVKRIGVVAAGGMGEEIRPVLLELLQGDGSLLEAVSLTAKMDAFRVAEAKKKECDYMLLVTVEVKSATDPGAFWKKGLDVAKSANAESLNFKNKEATVQKTDKQSDSVGRMAAKLTPTGKEKVSFTYILSAPGVAPVLSQTKEVASAGMNTLLEKFMNDVVNQALKP